MNFYHSKYYILIIIQQAAISRYMEKTLLFSSILNLVLLLIQLSIFWNKTWKFEISTNFWILWDCLCVFWNQQYIQGFNYSRSNILNSINNYNKYMLFFKSGRGIVLKRLTTEPLYDCREFREKKMRRVWLSGIYLFQT